MIMIKMNVLKYQTNSTYSGHKFGLSPKNSCRNFLSSGLFGMLSGSLSDVMKYRRTHNTSSYPPYHFIWLAGPSELGPAELCLVKSQEGLTHMSITSQTTHREELQSGGCF